jgi:ketosteroid isomerase-like protein
MESTVTPVSSGIEIHAHVKIVIVYRRQAGGEWRIARLMELLD